MWLSVSGSNGSDFQHHHWDIGPSGTIDTSTTNKMDYTWSLSGNGQDQNGSWSEISQSKFLSQEAAVRFDGSMVTLTQTEGWGTNQLQATGSVPHSVSEQIWPAVKWDPNAGGGGPTSVIVRDPGAPTYQLVTAPFAVPIPNSKPPAFKLVASLSLVLVPGVGGRTWTQQVFAIAMATQKAWWAWTINLVP
jgi:hypothetical protein